MSLSAIFSPFAAADRAATAAAGKLTLGGDWAAIMASGNEVTDDMAEHGARAGSTARTPGAVPLRTTADARVTPPQ